MTPAKQILTYLYSIMSDWTQPPAPTVSRLNYSREKEGVTFCKGFSPEFGTF